MIIKKQYKAGVSGSPSLVSHRPRVSTKIHVETLHFDFKKKGSNMDTDQFNVEELNEDASGASTVVDLTGKFKQPSGVVRNYSHKSEFALAMFAVTQMVNQFWKIVRNSRSVQGEPSVSSISTDVRTLTTVYCDVCATLEIPSIDPGDKKVLHGIIQSIMTDDGYRVSMAGANTKAIEMMERVYNRMLEQHNFYQGKSLRFGREQVEFIPVPTTSFEDVVMSDAMRSEHQMNVIDFLTNTEMQKITKKRGILLYGPPGTGKTSSIKAMFQVLSGTKGVTCIYVSDESFDKLSVQDVFAFINKYLAPALVVFEDIDLMAPDRRDGGSRLIGPLLSALNGIEEQKKPMVIMATTNRVDVLDAAITRPCRFDRRIEVGYPSEAEMHVIFKNVAGFEAPSGCFHSDGSTKMTGAHVEEIYRTAALLAQQKKLSPVECVKEAVETIKKHFMIVSPKALGFRMDDEPTGRGTLELPPSYYSDRKTSDPFKSDSKLLA
jgi:predicted AAA+ superfamily ATPase